MGSTRVAFSGTDEEIKAAMNKWLGSISSNHSSTPSSGKQISLDQRVINLEGQTKVIYDQLEVLEESQKKNPDVVIPQEVLDQITANKTEITKNFDSLTEAHQDINDFIKTHPSDEEMEAKLRILNDLITELKTSQNNAQLLINSNKAALAKIDKAIVPSNYRKLYRIMKGDSPSINVTDDILVFSKAGDMLTLEMVIPDLASDNEIIINDADPYPFFIAEYANDQDPLRARLKAGGLDFHVDGENAKVQIFCTADPKDIGHFEWRTKWNKVSVK